MCRLEVATQRDSLEEQFCFASMWFLYGLFTEWPASSCPLIGLFLLVIEIVMVNLFFACVVCFHCQILLCHSLTAGLHLVMVLICCVRLIVAL